MEQERHPTHKATSAPHTMAPGATWSMAAPGPTAGNLALERFLDRLRHLSEGERMLGDALDVIRQGFGPRRMTAWLTDEQLSGFRLVSAHGYGDDVALPEMLPEALAALFPAHMDLDAPVGAGLAPLVLAVPREADTAHLEAQLLVTLPGPHLVQGVLLLGPRDGGHSWELPHHLPLRQLALELGRTLSQLARTVAGPPLADSRVKPPAQFIARLEEELARAERFKRALTVMWLAIDVPPGIEDRETEQPVSLLVDAVGAWLASTLRVMDGIGKRPDRALVAVLPETTQHGAELLKSRLAALAVEQSFGLPRVARAKLRLRVGLASYPEQGVSSRFLLLAAERDSAEHKLEVEPHGPHSVIDSHGKHVEMVLGGGQPVASSHRMREVLELAKRVAPSKLTVLINGETGVGKERIAEFIHLNSDRRDKAEVRLNCGAIPETMIEAEFFGFERGSFTGAIRSTRGKFELADGGTLFLDEIGELSMAMQVKLLRVLDEQRFYRLGAATPCQVDVRVIAITNRDLSFEVQNGRFREDLFYRLNVVTIKIPALRERPEDIPPLVDRLISEFCDRTHLPLKKLALEAYDLLYSYPWRGNVRELRNVIERSVVVSRGNYITGEDLIRAVPDLAAARSSLLRPMSRPTTLAQQTPPSTRSSIGRQREQGVLDLIKRRPDIGLQDILREVGGSKSTGIRLLNELIARGQVVRRDRGKRSRYRISDGDEGTAES